MRIGFAIVAALAAGAFLTSTAEAAVTKKKEQVVERSAAGTIIQPTRTIIHHEDGTTTVIVVPRRSYLDTGTEVSVGDRKFMDYAFPPLGDPGRPNWYFGPDLRGEGSFPIPPPLYIPGLNSSPPYR
jgi:hypothetical protein